MFDTSRFFSITRKQRILIAGILMISAYLMNRLLGYAPVTIFLMMATTVLAGTPIFQKAFAALRYRILGIDALVTIAVTGAIIIGEYWEAAAVTFLFMLGDYLESRTIEKTRASIRELLDLAPEVTRVIRDGREVELSTEDVLKGDRVVVKPGEKISVDGQVVEGAAYVNQSAITGESMPVRRKVEDRVFSGTILESGYLVIEAVKVGEDTTFARILQMVEEAQDKKAKTQKFLEKFSRIYTPFIILMAVVLFVITRDLVLALTLLVIACPGALVISTPVSIVAGIGNGARHGVLVKGGDIMEKLGTVKVIAFDKTGTLTMGKPRVTQIKAFNMETQEVLRLSAIGEAYSEHPLGKAIIQHAEEQLGTISEIPDQTEIITGQGLVFTLKEKTYSIGNRRLFESRGISFREHEEFLRAEEEKGQTTVIFGDKHKIRGIISIADVVKEDAALLVSTLRLLGITKMVMLTGDNHRAGNAIGRAVGLDEVYGELLPEEKVKVLNNLQKKYGRVAMVGDGVNDAPALASADLGIAMGAAGSDVAMETADVVLMSDEMMKLAYAIGLSRATVVNIKQNVTFALAVAAMLLVGVLAKTVHLSIGMLIHELSVLLVIINAARLLRYGKSKEKTDQKTAVQTTEGLEEF